MKKIGLLMLVCFCISLIAFAQENKNTNESSFADYKIRLNFEYGAYKVKQPGPDTHFKSYSFGGKTYLKKLSSKHPVFLESGLYLQYYSDDYCNEYDYEYIISMFSFKVPVNVVYEVPTSNIDVAVYGGLSLRTNVWGEIKDERSDKYDLFDYNEHKGNIEYSEFERLQVGCQIGLHAIFRKKIIIGAETGFDFNDICKNTKLISAILNVGFCF